MRYLLDTNAVTGLANHRTHFANRVREVRRRGDQIGTCEPVIAELFFGLELSQSREANLARLRRTLSQIKTWPFDRAAAERYGQVAADLRRRGSNAGRRHDDRRHRPDIAGLLRGYV